MIGRIIAKRYKIISQLGAGGMGSVWKAQHLSLNSVVAIKLIDESISENPEVMQRFEKEAQASATLRSPHVVQVFDYGVDDKTPYIAMELLEGESLEQRLQREGVLDAENAVRVMTHVARAIGRAHEAGIVHRDLKPANIFLVQNGDEYVGKVLDFGIAKTQQLAGTGTRTGHMMGTPAYMSPEQAQGNKAIDGRTDLWAMGVIAFECLCGRMVFQGTAVGELILQVCALPIPVPSTVADVPNGFDAWFARALDRDVDQRFQTAKEWIDSFRATLGASTLGTTSGGAVGTAGSTLRGLGSGAGSDGAPSSHRRASVSSGGISDSAIDEPIESARTVHSPPVQSSPTALQLASQVKPTEGAFTIGPAGVPVRGSAGALAVLGVLAGLGIAGYFLLRPRGTAPAVVGAPTVGVVATVAATGASPSEPRSALPPPALPPPGVPERAELAAATAVLSATSVASSHVPPRTGVQTYRTTPTPERARPNVTPTPQPPQQGDARVGF